MPTKCSVPDCGEFSSKKCPFSFHRFPSSKYLSKKWLRALKLKGNFKLSAARVCSKHFSPQQYKQNGKLKPNAVPDVNLSAKKPTAPKLRKAPKHRETNESNGEIGMISPEYPTDPLEDPLSVPTEGFLDELGECSKKYGRDKTDRNETTPNDLEIRAAEFNESINVGTVSGDDNYGLDMIIDNEEAVYGDAEIAGNIRSSLFGENDASEQDPQLHVNPFQLNVLNDENMKYLTGHTKHEFEAIFDLCMKVNKGKEFKFKNLPLKEQMLLTLTKCRLNVDYFMLAIMFHLSSKRVSEVFRFWIDLLYETISTIVTSPEEQQMTWSSYKNVNTFKVLVGTDERGMVIFISEVYGGAMTDNLIVQKSNILDKLQKGDFVLADRGFEASDLLAAKGIILNKPPNKKGQQMPEKDVSQTRVIASRRVHVERVIGLAKKNRIITQKIPHHLFSLMPKIIPLLFFLLNFKPSICKYLESKCNCPKE